MDKMWIEWCINSCLRLLEILVPMDVSQTIKMESAPTTDSEILNGLRGVKMFFMVIEFLEDYLMTFLEKTIHEPFSIMTPFDSGGNNTDLE